LRYITANGFRPAGHFMTVDLPDYFEALSGAIDRLEHNNRAARGAIYDRARRLLIEEAHSADPPWHLMEIVREQRALEEAIVKAEGRYAAQVAMPPRPRRAPPPHAYDEFTEAEESDRAFYDENIDEGGMDTPPPVPPVSRMPTPARRRAEAPSGPAYPFWLWLIVGGLLMLLVIAAILLLRHAASPVAVEPAPPAKEAAAVAEAQQAAEEREQRARELIARGNELGRTQDFVGAIAAYSEAARLGPVDASVYNNRAFAYWSRGMTDEAIADYDEAIRLQPDNVVALTNRAVAHNFQGNYDLAIRDLDRALTLKPDSPDVLNSRCWGRALAGHTQAAVADCDQALKLRPNDPNTLDSRGFAYLKMGETDRAIADYSAALKIDPKLAGALFGRGVAKLRKGDKKGGEADIANAKAMRPEIEAIFERYGVR
jgi:tetratricopeptide (TPR) repeat protein